jgi:hypothetical protein
LTIEVTGTIHARLDEFDEAQRHWQRALDLYRTLHVPTEDLVVSDLGADPRCLACGASVSVGDGFCEACGRRQAPPCSVCGGVLISADGYCETCGLRQPTGRDHLEIETGAGAVGAVGAVSDRGLRHSRNEDAMSVSLYSEGVLAVVSDGVSSSNHPQDASQAAVDAAVTVLAERMEAGDDPETATRAAIQQAGLAVARLDDESSNPPACTYVSAIVGLETVTVGWVGDSRAYWLATDADDRDGGGDDTTGFFSSPRPTAGAVSGNGSSMLGSAILTVDDSLGGLEFTSHLLTSWLGADSCRAPTPPAATTTSPSS